MKKNAIWVNLIFVLNHYTNRLPQIDWEELRFKNKWIGLVKKSVNLWQIIKLLYSQLNILKIIEDKSKATTKQNCVWLFCWI